MPEDNQPKKNRRCSYCRYIGHTKRQCLVLRTFAPEQLPKTMAAECPNDPRILADLLADPISTSVPVRTFGAIMQSPHIVDLEDKTPSHWDDVAIYRMVEPLTVPERTVVNFSDIVATAATSYQRKQKVARIEKYREYMRQLRERSQTAGVTARMITHRLVGSLRAVWQIEQRENLFVATRDLIGAIKKRLHLKHLLPLTLAITLLIGLPFPAIGYYQRLKNDTGAVVAESTTGFLALQSSTMAAFHADLPQAESDLTSALQSFSAAENFLNNDHQLLTSILGLLPVVGPQVTSRAALLNAGQHLALGNAYLMKGVGRASEDANMELTDRIGVMRDHLKAALPQYRAALDDLAAVDPSAIPVEYQATFTHFRVLFATIVDDLANVVELGNAMQMAFGDDSFKRYLIVFQNNHELRPTGGFMGSYAILDVQKGKILRLEIPPGGTYDLQGQLDTTVKPPLPLQLVNGRWEFQDANWYPDFAASAKKMEWFYAHGRGTSVDGVIAVNASVLERLLAVLGPIDAEKYHLLLTSDTVLSSVEHVVQHGADKAAGKPKAILSELLAQMIDVTQNVKPLDALRLLTELHDAMNQKEIQMYFNDPPTQATFHRYGWTGELVDTAPGHDYLAVSIANLQGEKSDAVVDETIDHQAVVGGDGEVEDTVVIHRTHHGDSAGVYDTPNMSYVRIYVPAGAVLLDAGGFTYPPDTAFHVPEKWYADDADLASHEQETGIDQKTGTHITAEFGKTSFGNWVLTKPGETSDVYFTYRLPERLDMRATYGTSDPAWQNFILGNASKRFSSYDLTLQKQSGTAPKIKSTIIYPTGWLPVWTSDEHMVAAKNGVVAAFDLAADRELGVVMQAE